MTTATTTPGSARRATILSLAVVGALTLAACGDDGPAKGADTPFAKSFCPKVMAWSDNSVFKVNAFQEASNSITDPAQRKARYLQSFDELQANADDFEAAKPLFDVVGGTVVHVGPSGAGQTVKAANQLIVAANIEALAEALVFLEAYGVDTKAALEVLGGGLAGSKVLEQKKENMLSRTFEPGFRIELHHKDLGIVTSAAREAGVVIPLGAVVAQLMASARAAGDGGLDHSGLLRGVERLSGR